VKKIIVIGSGFSGLSAATCLANKGYQVTILEKHNQTGGRARRFTSDGFTFDMGPSWYWMPDVFESYFNKFGKSVKDYYELIRLDPSYAVIYGKDEVVNIPAQMSELKALFNSLEAGSGQKLEAFLQQAAYKYQVGINQLVYKPGRSITEFLSLKLLVDMVRMDIFKSIRKHVSKYFTHDKIVKLMEFPILFLGATPENTPALYSLMNYADLQLGTWYPKGGMYQIVKAMEQLALEQRVNIELNQEVQKIVLSGNQATHVETNQGTFKVDAVVGSADYHHIETSLLPQSHRSYTDSYWQKRVMAPSSLIFYLGINKKLQGLEHHNLFFDESFELHAKEIYETPKWPEKPLFYVSVTSKTDNTVAPQGQENLFILMPVAPGIEDNEDIREKYFNLIVDRLERLTNQTIRPHIVFKKSYAHIDFINDYHSFKGNAYGLANTLLQTAILKPSLKSKKVKNLYYTGQLTVPGPGVPPSLISGQVVANELVKELK